MIELLDTLPDVNVQPAEYKRLLGLPSDYVMTGRTRELADCARAWYVKHGRPWLYARSCERLEIADAAIRVDGVLFNSSPLRKMLDQARAKHAILAAVSAGPELELEAQALWQAEKPDEYFFLEMYGSAVVEHLIALTGARLCAWAEAPRHGGAAALQPGLPGVGHRRPAPPSKAHPAVAFAGTSGRGRSPRFRDASTQKIAPGRFWPDLARRAGPTTYGADALRKLLISFLPISPRAVPADASNGQPEAASTSAESSNPTITTALPLSRHANYSVNSKALRRWAEERLTLIHCDDGTIEARFRYEGTTCTNMGRELAFDYHVVLGPREEGYCIREQHCGPAPGDTGHTYMCRYMNNAEHLMVAIDREKPLIGYSLDEVLSWERPNDPAGCYCEPASRKHKWGLVLETIHFALAAIDAN